MLLQSGVSGKCSQSSSAQLKVDDSVNVLVLEVRSDDLSVVSECMSLVVNAEEMPPNNILFFSLVDQIRTAPSVVHVASIGFKAQWLARDDGDGSTTLCDAIVTTQ